MSQSDESPEYWADVARMTFEEDLLRLMERESMSRADFARAIGHSTAYVSKILNGEDENYQLKTMAKLGRAVRGVLEVHLINEDDEVVRVLNLDESELLDAIRENRRPTHVSAEVTDITRVESGKVLPFSRSGEAERYYRTGSTAGASTNG